MFQVIVIDAESIINLPGEIVGLLFGDYGAIIIPIIFIVIYLILKGMAKSTEEAPEAFINIKKTRK